MKFRELGRTGWKVSEISFGAWAIGGAWGDVDDQESLAALHAALDGGVNFFDTADVYGDGRSERLLARLKKERKENFYITTKAGRRLPKQTPEGYSRENLTAWIERSLRNLETDAIDLLQLHCPHPDVYYRPEVFGILDELVKAGKIRHYGVSVEKVEEALKAIEFPGVQTVQIIFNIFRQRPRELFFPEARRRKVGILARVPLASGLLSGKFTRRGSTPNDARRVAFDFPPVEREHAYDIVEAMEPVARAHEVSVAQIALAWLLQRTGVMSVIVGAKTIEQLDDNLAAVKVGLTAEEVAALDKASALKPEYPGWMLERQGGQRLPTPTA